MFRIILLYFLVLLSVSFVSCHSQNIVLEYNGIDLLKASEDDVPIIVKGLKDSDENVRIGVALALKELGGDAEEATPELVEALGDRNPLVRTYAAIALGKIGAKAVPGLIKSLDSERDWERGAAIHALGLIGEDASPALPKLMDLAITDNSIINGKYYIREAAKDAIEKIETAIEVK